MRMKGRGAFTLIEMLTVLVIIGILLGLLTGVFMKAKESARRRKCEGEVRELVRAWHAYYGAFGSLPPGVTMDPTMVQFLQGNNALKIKFMDFPPEASTSGFMDPWGHPYRISLQVKQLTNTWQFATRVCLHNRDRSSYE